jgi:hypothetical protein
VISRQFWNCNCRPWHCRMSATGCGSGVAAQPAGYSQRHAPASQLATLDEPLAPVAPPLPSAAMAPFRQSQTAAPPLPAPSEGTSKLLLVVVISGGSPPGAPSMSLKCSDAGVSSRGHDQAVLASLPALTHAQKLSVRSPWPAIRAFGPPSAALPTHLFCTRHHLRAGPRQRRLPFRRRRV